MIQYNIQAKHPIPVGIEVVILRLGICDFIKGRTITKRKKEQKGKWWKQQKSKK